MYRYSIEDRVYTLTENKYRRLRKMYPEVPEPTHEDFALYMSFIEINGRFIYSLDGRFNY